MVGKKNSTGAQSGPKVHYHIRTVKYAQNSINGIDQKPNPTFYKETIVPSLDLANDTDIQSLIQIHKEHIPQDTSIMIDPYKGCMYEGI